jgi:hexosaminidase
MKFRKSLWVLVTFFWISCIQATSLPQIPSLTTFKEDNHALGFQLTSKTEIVVDAKYANTKIDKHSPSLLDYAHTLSSDLSEISGFKSIRVRTESSKNQRQYRNVIYLTVLPETSAKKYKYYNGNATDEAYELDINQDVIKISGSSVIGTFWGTRSVLQQVAIHQKQPSSHISIPAGSGVDVPGWEVRGFM